MKKILIFLILFLSGAWAYTSWYWYSCNIKELCSEENSTSDIQENGEEQILSTSGALQQDDDIGDIDEDSIMLSDEEIVSLSTGDVTGPSNIPTSQAPVVQEEDEEEDVTPELEVVGEEESLSPTPERETASVARNICQNPLVGPISLGANNNPEEVLALERFLIVRGLLVASDGIFGNDDFEAVKELQEEFRSEILTPWGINNPTGYVGRTTIQKIQELSCR